MGGGGEWEEKYVAHFRMHFQGFPHSQFFLRKTLTLTLTEEEQVWLTHFSFTSKIQTKHSSLVKFSSP